MMLPRIQQFGLIKETPNMDTLTQELANEMHQAAHSFIRDVNFGICAVEP